MPAPVLWQPSAAQAKQTHLHQFMAGLVHEGVSQAKTWDGLFAYSITQTVSFWAAVARYAGLVLEGDIAPAHNQQPLPYTRWLPNARLNFAENLLQPALTYAAAQEVVVAYREGEAIPSRCTGAQLVEEVAALSAYLRAAGVSEGDRVTGILSHSYEAIVAMLATTSIGAIWSSASPDFGIDASEDRFSQIEPKVLIMANGYHYGGKRFEKIDAIEALLERIPSIESCVVINQLSTKSRLQQAHCVDWHAAIEAHRGASPAFKRLPADHPVFILFSSGTTGRPKCIVHSAGGVLLDHASELYFHADLHKADRFFYYTTCGWMMWNWQVSGLMTGATLIVYDGSPSYPDIDELWRLCSVERVTHFGTSARFLAACRNADIKPINDNQLDDLRMVFSTGSPLLHEDFDWFYRSAAPNALLGSIIGGTDICGCFLGSNPLLPVRRGEIQASMLGKDIAAFNDAGEPVVGESAELVCRTPTPSMPLFFWGDDDGSRYRKTYFERFSGVWAHGDFIEITPEGGAIVYGRSDTTLNPGGIRIGTAEIYRQVETMQAIVDSIAAGRPYQGDEQIVLLVVLAQDSPLDQELSERMRAKIRQGASPKHVPKHIVAVPQIPYSRSGKKVEMAISRMLRHDLTRENDAALANPESLEQIFKILKQAQLI
jgi:acetoacetyl-CoA synthetase